MLTFVKWSDFIVNVDKYIDKAYELQENIDDYEMCKEVWFCIMNSKKLFNILNYLEDCTFICSLFLYHE